MQELQAKNPWTADTSPITDPQWDYLAGLARQELRAEGIDADRLGSKGTLLLRERSAELRRDLRTALAQGLGPACRRGPGCPRNGW